jgi:hypothetical protein
LALTFEDELAWSAALKRIAFRHAARGPFVRQAHESDATDLRIMTYAQAHDENGVFCEYANHRLPGRFRYGRAP